MFILTIYVFEQINKQQTKAKEKGGAESREVAEGLMAPGSDVTVYQETQQQRPEPEGSRRDQKIKRS